MFRFANTERVAGRVSAECAYVGSVLKHYEIVVAKEDRKVNVFKAGGCIIPDRIESKKRALGGRVRDAEV